MQSKGIVQVPYSYDSVARYEDLNSQVTVVMRQFSKEVPEGGIVVDNKVFRVVQNTHTC